MGIREGTDEEKAAAQTLRELLAEAVAEETRTGDMLQGQRYYGMSVRVFLDKVQGRPNTD